MKFLSYNIQAGIGTIKPSAYFTAAHRQVVSDGRKKKTLADIAEYISSYDIVCLQEVDLGGLRSGYTDQAHSLKTAADFPFMVTQTNRRVGRFSVHGNVILSKKPIQAHVDLKLPGTIAGRGLLIAKIGVKKPLWIANTHFSLGEKDQQMQFAYVQEKLGSKDRVIFAGDFNCTHRSKPLRDFDAGSDLDLVTEHHHFAFPSWKPSRAIDHIFVSKSFGPVNCEVGSVLFSDHLPLELRIKI